MLTSQSNADFQTARRRADMEDLISAFTGRKHQDLLSFDDVARVMDLHDSSYRGLREIEVDKIVGSTGRYRDFTRTFLPRESVSPARWRTIDSIADGTGFPPIEVYQVGDVYFVRDGNHRVSVARQHGINLLEAYVIEYRTDIPITTEDDLEDIILRSERKRFLAETRLNDLRPNHNIEFTEVGRYHLVLQHIEFHRFLKSQESEHEMPFEEAVVSWYDTVYLPVIDTIRREDVLQSFPQRTEADFVRVDPSPPCGLGGANGNVGLRPR